jgi:hypothetical protein
VCTDPARARARARATTTRENIRAGKRHLSRARTTASRDASTMSSARSNDEGNTTARRHIAPR